MMKNDIKYIEFIEESISMLPFRIEAYMASREDIDHAILLAFLGKLFNINDKKNPTQINFLFSILKKREGKEV